MDNRVEASKSKRKEIIKYLAEWLSKRSIGMIAIIPNGAQKILDFINKKNRPTNK